MGSIVTRCGITRDEAAIQTKCACEVMLDFLRRFMKANMDEESRLAVSKASLATPLRQARV